MSAAFIGEKEDAMTKLNYEEMWGRLFDELQVLRAHHLQGLHQFPHSSTEWIQHNAAKEVVMDILVRMLDMTDGRE